VALLPARELMVELSAAYLCAQAGVARLSTFYVFELPFRVQVEAVDRNVFRHSLTSSRRLR